MGAYPLTDRVEQVGLPAPVILSAPVRPAHDPGAAGPKPQPAGVTVRAPLRCQRQRDAARWSPLRWPR